MSNSISHKKSSVPGKIPVAADLEVGELAINFADKKVYTKTAAGNIIELGGGAFVRLAGDTMGDDASISFEPLVHENTMLDLGSSTDVWMKGLIEFASIDAGEFTGNAVADPYTV